MSAPDQASATAAGVRARRRPAQGGGFPSFRLLEGMSFVASAVFTGLLTFWLGPDVPAATMVLGWTHGLLWIAMSALCLVAVRRGTIPFWLAVTVAVIGGVGPFAGTVGFLVESRRRKRALSGA
jgi:hypothetical protein